MVRRSHASRVFRACGRHREHHGSGPPGRGFLGERERRHASVHVSLVLRGRQQFHGGESEPHVFGGRPVSGPADRRGQRREPRLLDRGRGPRRASRHHEREHLPESHVRESVHLLQRGRRRPGWLDRELALELRGRLDVGRVLQQRIPLLLCPRHVQCDGDCPRQRRARDERLQAGAGPRPAAVRGPVFRTFPSVRRRRPSSDIRRPSTTARTTRTATSPPLRGTSGTGRTTTGVMCTTRSRRPGATSCD